MHHLIHEVEPDRHRRRVRAAAADLRQVKRTVVQAVFPSLVVWASLWPDRPDDQIRFDIEDQRFTWTLMGVASAAAEERLAQLRYRLDVMINADLRISFGN